MDAVTAFHHGRFCHCQSLTKSKQTVNLDNNECCTYQQKHWLFSLWAQRSGIMKWLSCKKHCRIGVNTVANAVQSAYKLVQFYAALHFTPRTRTTKIIPTMDHRGTIVGPISITMSNCTYYYPIASCLKIGAHGPPKLLPPLVPLWCAICAK